MPDSWIDKEELDELVGSFASPRKRRRAAARLPRPRRAKASFDETAAGHLPGTPAPYPGMAPGDVVRSAVEAPVVEIEAPGLISEPGRGPDPAPSPEAAATVGASAPASTSGMEESVEVSHEKSSAAGPENAPPISWSEVESSPSPGFSPFEFDDDDELEFEIEESLPEDDLPFESDLSEPLTTEGSRFELLLDDSGVTWEAFVEEQVAEEVVAEVVVAEDELAEDELAEDELAEDELAGDELAGDELAGDELAGDELAEDELAEDELVVDSIGETATSEDVIGGVDFSDPEEPAIIPNDEAEPVEAVLAEEIPVAEMIVAIEEPAQWEREIPDFLDDSESFVMPHSAVERDSERALAALRAARARAEEGRLLRDWQPVADTPGVDEIEKLEDDHDSDPDESSDPEHRLAGLEEISITDDEPGEQPVFRTLSERIAHCVNRATDEVGVSAAVICDEDGFLLYEHSGHGAGLSRETGLLIDAVRQADARLGLTGEGVTQISIGDGQWRCLLRANEGTVRLHAGLLVDRPLEATQIAIWKDVLADSCRFFSTNPI